MTDLKGIGINLFSIRHGSGEITIVTVVLIFAVTFVLSCSGPAGPDGDNAVPPDTLYPFIKWISPDPGESVDSFITLRAQAYDLSDIPDTQGVWRMVFYAGGLEFRGILTDTIRWEYSYEWIADNFPEGQYPLMARAWDGTRQHSTTPVIFINVEH